MSSNPIREGGKRRKEGNKERKHKSSREKRKVSERTTGALRGLQDQDLVIKEYRYYNMSLSQY